MKHPSGHREVTEVMADAMQVGIRSNVQANKAAFVSWPSETLKSSHCKHLLNGDLGVVQPSADARPWTESRATFSREPCGSGTGHSSEGLLHASGSPEGPMDLPL